MHYSFSELTALRCTDISEVAFTFQQWKRRKLGHLPITPDFPVMALSLRVTMPAVFKPLSLGIMTIPFGLFLAAVFHKKVSLCNSFICCEAKDVESLKEHRRTLLLELSYLQRQSEFLLPIFFNLMWLLHFTLLRISETMAICHLNTFVFSSCIFIIYFHCQSRTWSAVYECKFSSDVEVIKELYCVCKTYWEFVFIGKLFRWVLTWHRYGMQSFVSSQEIHICMKLYIFM